MQRVRIPWGCNHKGFPHFTRLPFQSPHKLLMGRSQERSPCGPGRKRGRKATVNPPRFFSLTKRDRLCRKEALKLILAGGQEGPLQSFTAFLPLILENKVSNSVFVTRYKHAWLSTKKLCQTEKRKQPTEKK